MSQGDIWTVPAMPLEEWDQQRDSVWQAVERELHNGWHFKLEDAYRLAGTTRFGGVVAVRANELGAPVGQMFTACALRAREST